MVRPRSFYRQMIHLYYGPDSFSMREEVQRVLRAALPAESADLNTTKLSHDQVTLDSLRFACEAAPFLADRRCVVVEQFFSRSGTRRGRTAKPAMETGETGEAAPAGVVTAVADYLVRLPASAVLLFVETEAPPKTGPIARALEAAHVKQQFFGTLAGQPLVRWIKERTRQAGGQIEDAAAHLLATFAGGNLTALSNEISKLIAYAGPGKTVSAGDVRLLVNEMGEINVFALVDAIGQEQQRGALEALHALQEGGERPERILGMVARQVRLLLQARDLQDRGAPPDAAARALGLNGFPLRKVQEQARLFTLARLAQMHRQTLETDQTIKTGLQEPALALELLVAGLTQRTERPGERVAPGRGRAVSRR